MKLAVVLVSVLLTSSAVPATATVRCDRASKCDGAILDELRTAVEVGCPCDAATSRRGYARCWKPAVKGLAKARGKAGFPRSCRSELAHALSDSTCGRPGFVLCQRATKKGAVCAVAKAKKCHDPFPVRTAHSCVDTCDQATAIPFPTTKELATADLASLAPDPGDGTLVFATAPAALANVAVGDVLVAGVSSSTPAGLLRAVLAVERDGDALTLRTGQAPIQLAYRKLHARFARALTVPGGAAASLVDPQAVSATRPFTYLLFDGDGDPSTTNDQIAIDGILGGGFDFNFMLDVDWGQIDSLPDVVTNCIKSFVNVFTGGTPSCSIDSLLPEAKVTFVVLPEVNADANVHGAAILDYEKDVDLDSETLAPIIVGPLVFVPVADITAELSGGASGSFSTGLHGSALFETSVTVSSKQTGTPQFHAPVLKSTDFGPNDTSVSLTARAKVGAGARLNLLLFGVAGPYATARAYGAIEAEILDTPCWSLHAGIDADLGIKVTSPALPLIGEVTLVDWRAPTVTPLDVEVATGACQPPPDASTLPPGSGPDAMHLAAPTFVPWSRSWSPPVEGAGLPDNGSIFADLQHTIDGGYVRSGFGVKTLTKFADGGRLVWARNLDIDGDLIRPLRVRSTTDAALVVASRAFISGGDIVLTRLAQDGTVIDARGYDVPIDVCSVAITALANDGAGGVYVTGTCGGDPPSFLLHARADGDATLSLIGDIQSLRLNVIEPIGDGVFLAGSSVETTPSVAFPLNAIRLAADGSVIYSKRYDGCASAPDGIPSAAIVGSQGEVTIAGSGGAQHNGLVLRILPDGNVGFATFPGYGFGVGSVFLLDSIVELPTTGYVAGASAVRFTGIEPEDVSSAALVGLDAAGHVLWSQRYTYGAPGNYARSGYVAVGLTDDGGALATAHVQDPADPLGGFLWAFKPFAKDGSIDFSPGAATVTPLGVIDLDCSMIATDRAVTVTSMPVAVQSIPVSSTPVTLDEAQQTAQ